MLFSFSVLRFKCAEPLPISSCLNTEHQNCIIVYIIIYKRYININSVSDNYLSTMVAILHHLQYLENSFNIPGIPYALDRPLHIQYIITFDFSIPHLTGKIQCIYQLKSYQQFYGKINVSEILQKFYFLSENSIYLHRFHTDKLFSYRNLILCPDFIVLYSYSKLLSKFEVLLSHLHRFFN